MKKDHKRQRLLAIRELQESYEDDYFSMRCFLQNDYFVRAIEAYLFDSSLFIVSEHMPLSLNQIIAVPTWPNELLVAAIVGQVSLLDLSSS